MLGSCYDVNLVTNISEKYKNIEVGLNGCKSCTKKFSLSIISERWNLNFFVVEWTPVSFAFFIIERTCVSFNLSKNTVLVYGKIKCWEWLDYTLLTMYLLPWCMLSSIFIFLRCLKFRFPLIKTIYFIHISPFLKFIWQSRSNFIYTWCLGAGTPPSCPFTA